MVSIWLQWIDLVQSNIFNMNNKVCEIYIHNIPVMNWSLCADGSSGGRHLGWVKALLWPLSSVLLLLYSPDVPKRGSVTAESHLSECWGLTWRSTRVTAVDKSENMMRQNWTALLEPAFVLILIKKKKKKTHRWNVTKFVYSSTVVRLNFEVLDLMSDFPPLFFYHVLFLLFV